VGAFSAVALSYAHSIPINITNGLLADEHAAIGVTAKYVMGHALFIAQDEGSTFGGNDILLRFPVILPDSNYNGTLGNGMGADLSAAWSGGPWKVGLLAENVFNAFKWDTTVLAYAPGTGGFNTDTTGTNFDRQSYSAAPKALRDIVAAQAFKPAFTFGAALRVTSGLTLTADMKTTLGGNE